MTSANVSEFTIYDNNGKQVGNHRQNWLCKTNWDALLRYEPLEDHSIQEWGYDEEEEYWEEEPINLKKFLNKK